MLKKLILSVVIFFCFISVSWADNTAIVDEDLTITLPNFVYQGSLFNYTAILKYDTASQTWRLFALEKHSVDYPVDSYGFDSVAFIAEVNKYRSGGAPCSTGGKSLVVWDQQLADAALAHSADMAINNYMGHIGTDGSTPWDRIARTAFAGTPLGENVAAGQPNVKAVVLAWSNSPPHCANMMSDQATVMGYAWAIKAGTQYRIYHTMLTGK
jgi:uncharacterized protein YkwD